MVALVLMLCSFGSSPSEAGADPNRTGGEDFSHLMVAAYHCYADIAGLLIEHGIDVNFEDQGGGTAKSQAVKRNCDEVIDLIDRASPR